jgi:sulfide:quinone oxidoreductase
MLRFEGGADSPADMVIATPLHHAPDVLKASGLAPEGGWVPVDRETFATRFEDVYAIGDATSVPLAGGLALPKAGVFAHGQAEVVSRNIAAEINGGEPIWAFGGQGACFLETGRGKGAYVTGRFYAEPPEVRMHRERRFWHWARLGFERTWLWRWF